MRIKNAMLYSAVQLWKLVTAIQHFKQNLVITGLSLSLTPSPLDAIPGAAPFTFTMDVKIARLGLTFGGKNAQNTWSFGESVRENRFESKCK